jgi:aarF domain-containing kinase
MYFQVFEDNFAHCDLHPGNILVREEETSDMTQKKSSWHTSPFLISKSTCPVSIVILDCGIIASLDDRGKKCLKGVFKAVANGDVSTGSFLMVCLCRKVCTAI